MVRFLDSPKDLQRRGTPMTALATRPRQKLRHGPYASARYDEERGEWIVSLTDEGRAVAEAFLVPYPAPAKIALTARETQAQARWFMHTFGNDALSNVCLAAVADAVRLWFPERACLATTVGWQIRAQMSRYANHELKRGLTGFDIKTIPPEERVGLVRSGHYGLIAGGARSGDPTAFDPFGSLLGRPEPDPFAGELLERLCRKAGLTDRERTVVEMRIGGETLNEIGDRFGVSKERIRQIFVAAMLRLRAAAERLGYTGEDADGQR